MKYFRCKTCGFLQSITDDDYKGSILPLAYVPWLYDVTVKCCKHPDFWEE